MSKYPIAVLAGNAEQFREHQRAHPGENFYYVGSIERAMGMWFSAIVEIGTFEQRRDAGALRAYVTPLVRADDRQVAMILAYGLLWLVPVDRMTTTGLLVSEARRALLGVLDQSDRLHGIQQAKSWLVAQCEAKGPRS